MVYFDANGGKFAGDANRVWSTTDILVELDGRAYKKANEQTAYCAYYTYDSGVWTGVLLISTESPEAVNYRSEHDGFSSVMGYKGSFVMNGITWYYGGGDASMRGVLPDASTRFRMFFDIGSSQDVLVAAQQFAQCYNTKTSRKYSSGFTYSVFPTQPTRDDYEFIGWWTSPSGGTQVFDTNYFDSSVSTIYARWEWKRSYVSFNTNGGTFNGQANKVSSAGESLLVLGGREYRKAYDGEAYCANHSGGDWMGPVLVTTIGADASRYTSAHTNHSYVEPFGGSFELSGKTWYYSGGNACWSPTIDTSGEFRLRIDTPTHDILEAAKQLVQRYDTETSKTVVEGEIFGELPPNPTRAHYNFIGWWTEQNGGYRVSENTNVPVGGFSTLYARWELKTYTLRIYYQLQSVSNKTNLSITAEGCSVSNQTLTGAGGNSLVSHTYSASSCKISISASNANASSKISYYLGAGFSPTASRYSGINSLTYTWTPDSNNTILIYVKQRYEVSFSGNGYTSGIVPSQMYKIYGTDLTIPSNNLARIGYTANGWNLNSTLTATPTYTTTYTANADAILYANWTANTYTMYFDENGGSTVSDKTVTYDGTYGTLPTPTRTGCTFGGWYTTGNFTTQVTSSTVVKTARNHYLYAKWIDNGANDLKYDSTEKYFYFEDGEYPQTYVGTALNSTLNSASLTQTGTLEYFNGTGNIKIPIYSYSGSEYAKLTAEKTMTLTLSGGSFTFTSGQSYWFKVEPIRWRVSAYGVSSTAYPSGLSAYGSTKTNFTVVSDKVLTVGAVTNTRTKEGWSFTESELFNIIKENSTTLTEYHKTNESIVYDEYASSSGIIKVTSSSATYTGIRVASETDIKTNFTDMSAKASDMVKFLLGTSSEYVDYWTRDLVTLNNGKVVTKVGETMSRWLDRTAGVRFAMSMKEGIRIS